MMFISYAQNFEDVMLWRALGHVAQGFYIDVGANHPDEDSVTRAFYDRGWSGINIEPLAKHARQLELARPRDINLQVAVGDASGEIELFDTSVRGLATASAAVAEMHASAGLQTQRSVVPMRRLQDICAEYAPENIHFLKIDVEGFEAKVLAGMDLRRFRPWVLLIEATIPNSSEIDASWEPGILAAGYRYVYFDGLNRYYIPEERPELAQHFNAPPNVFDSFIMAETVAVRRQWAIAQEEAEAEAEALSRKLDEAERQLDAIRNSSSWRITAPLRDGVVAAQAFRQNFPNRAFTRLTSIANRLPLLRRVAGKLARTLGLHDRLLPLFNAAKEATSAKPVPFVGEASHGDWPRMAVGALPMHPTLPQAACLEVPASQMHLLRLTGHVEGHYSLAIVNRGLANGLETLHPGSVAFQPCHGEPYDNPSDIPAKQLAQLKSMFARVGFAAREMVSIVHHYPIITDPNPASLRLIFFFWEETAIPGETIAQLNNNFDAVLVAADFVRRALINSGCCIPVLVVPLGIDHLIDTNQPAISDLRPPPGQPFRFLHVSSVFERKGPDTLLRAYLETFTVDDPVELFIKTFPNPHNRITDQWRELSAGLEKPPKVIIDESPLDDTGMLALYRSAHAMVLPTRGEGFNLPAAEALALGLPLIVTGHGAHLDFATQANALLTPFRFSRSKSHVSAGDACWVSANPADLALQMQRLLTEIESNDAALAERRARGIREIRATYSWQACATAVHRGIDWLISRQGKNIAAAPAMRRLALISPWQTRCGIAEYSHNLLSAFAIGESWALKVYCDSRTSTDPTQSLFHPSWQIGDGPSVCATLDLLANQRHDVILMQHQPSLFPLTSAVCCRLADLASRGATVVLELHSSLPLLTDHRLSARTIAALRKISRIVVHKEDDLNHLLTLGLCNNVVLIAHGVIQPLPDAQKSNSRAALGIPDDALVLASFGFALPHKGGDTLVDTIKPLRNACGRPVHLIGLNSILDQRSEETLEGWQKSARNQGVDREITWISDYRPISECQDILGLADYIVFPYRDTRESASGAVTIGLSSLKPVLVSPLEIFSDVTDCTWRMDGHEAADIVAAICHLEADTTRVADLRQRQSDWLAERNWERVSSRFEAMLQGLQIQRQLDAATRRPTAPASETPRQLFVDVSELYFRDARTGIQRVVRSVLSELFVSPPPDYVVCPVFAEKGKDWQHTARFTPDGGSRNKIAEGSPLKIQAGDIFLGLDLSAHLFPEAEERLRTFRLAGARIHFVVYDIIPLRYPQFTISDIHDAFNLWMHSLARQADGLLCISSAVADDVRCWLTQNVNCLPHPDVRHFHLGADISNSLPSTGRPENAEQIIAALAGAPVFLMVGTIEPRKGQEQTLDACEALWASGIEARLVLVGKEGWMMESFAARLRQHPEQTRRLFWLEGVNDEFLEELYTAASCLIAASITEGFGLPLIEAAQHGLPIIARDIPVFRELAGRHAYYFSGTRPADLERALNRWLLLHENGKAPTSTGMRWLTWQQSTAALKEIVLEDLS